MTTITNSQGASVNVYATWADAVYYEIASVIEAGGASRDEFDLDAIAAEILEWHDEMITDSNGDPAIWMPATGYCCNIGPDDDYTFWATVEAHAL